jgi:hypothetical protein
MNSCPNEIRALNHSYRLFNPLSLAERYKKTLDMQRLLGEKYLTKLKIAQTPLTSCLVITTISNADLLELSLCSDLVKI